MENESNPVAEVRQKRKYTRRNVAVVAASKDGVRLYGIPLEVDPDCIEQMKRQQVSEREKEFRQSVLSKFEGHITELKQGIVETGQVPETIELPATLGTASAEFSSTPTADRVLIPGNDYAIRIHVGLMALMQWATNQIATLQKEIVELKHNAGVTTNNQDPEPTAGTEFFQTA